MIVTKQTKEKEIQTPKQLHPSSFNKSLEDYIYALKIEATKFKPRKDQTKQVAEEVTQTVRAMYQEGHIDKPTAEYLLPPPMVRTQEMYFHIKTRPQLDP